MTYRYHPEAGNPATRLGIAQLANGAAINPQDFALTGVSNEDARLFRFHGELSMSWVQSDFIGQARPKAIVKYGHLKTVFKGDTVPPELVIEKAYHIPIGGNDWNDLQKNWCFFEVNERLLCVYQSFPEQVVFHVQSDVVTNQHKTPGKYWPYGPIRGGAIVPYDGKLLRFFHSRVDCSPFASRYFVGAMLMEPTIPFAPIRVSRKPILYGSEEPRAKCLHFKPNVVFPCGAVVDGDSFILALGVNDSSCMLARIRPENLNL